ncbi:MAG: MBL fold metallo-hydrolase [Thermoplasmata archaeon]
MNIIPLAAESLGVRSMAVFVETPGLKLLIDPGVSLAPKRFGLGPSKMELAREKALWKKVMSCARKADALTISHYHFDHYNPDRPDMFSGKQLFIKHPADNINQSQKGRAEIFFKAIEGIPNSVEFADGAEFEFGNTAVKFSKAVPHGTNTRLGYVIQTGIECKRDIFLHTSDVEGPSLDSQLDFILEMQPTVVACDGPMTYLMYKYGNKAMERSLANLERIMRETPCKTLMLDHHLPRDPNWRGKLQPVFQAGRECGCNVTTFAGSLGKEDDLLEARRREIVTGGRDK